MNTQIISDIDIEKHYTDTFKSFLGDVPKNIIFNAEINDILATNELYDIRQKCLGIEGLNDLERVILINMLCYDKPVEVCSSEDFTLKHHIPSYEVLEKFVSNYVWFNKSIFCDLRHCVFVPYTRDSYGEVMSYALFDNTSINNNCNGNIQDLACKLVDFGMPMVTINGEFFPRMLYDCLTGVYDFKNGVPSIQKLLELVNKCDDTRKYGLWCKGLDDNGEPSSYDNISLDVFINSLDILLHCRVEGGVYIKFMKVNTNFEYLDNKYQIRQLMESLPDSFTGFLNSYEVLKLYKSLETYSLSDLEEYINNTVGKFNANVIFHRGFNIYLGDRADTGDKKYFYVTEFHDNSGNYSFMFTKDGEKFVTVYKGKVLLDFEEFKIIES